MASITRIRPYRVISGVGAGAGAALVMLIVMALLRFGFNFPTIAELMLNTIVRLLGGEAFSSALDNLYYAGRPLLFTIILEGTLLLGVLLGLLYAWLARPNPTTGRRATIFDSPLAGIIYGLVLGLLLNVVFLPLVDQPVFADRPYGIYANSPIPLWAGLMLLALVFGVTVQGLLPKPPSPEVATRARAGAAPVLATEPGTVVASAPAPQMLVESAESVDRRSFLRIGGGALAALIGGLVFWYGGTVLNQGGFTSPVRSVANSGGEAGTGGTGTGSGSASGGAAAGAATDTPAPLPTDTAAPLPTGTTGAAAANTPEAAQPTATAGEAAQAQPTATPEPAAPTAEPTVALPVIKTQEITPVDSFYHVSKNFFDPSPSADGWKLEFKGMVNKPYSLDYKALTSLPAIKVTTGMMCISNPVGGGLIGNEVWKGVHLADLIKKAGPQVGVTKVVLRAVDDYSDSIAFQKALDPNVMLVWEMGGQPLTSQHGFPARLLVPGIYGMKHVKWLTSVELVNYDFKGFWQDPSQGWSDPAPVNTMSRIDFPYEGTLNAGPQDISGVAFAGDRSISKVEVSTDGGHTWNQAYVKPPLSHTSWVVWGYKWTPAKAGKYTVMVRATDGKGNLQTAQQADSYPNGATGYHTITYMVKGGTGQAPKDDGTVLLGIHSVAPKQQRAPGSPTNQ